MDATTWTYLQGGGLLCGPLKVLVIRFDYRQEGGLSAKFYIMLPLFI